MVAKRVAQGAPPAAAPWAAARDAAEAPPDPDAAAKAASQRWTVRVARDVSRAPPPFALHWAHSGVVAVQLRACVAFMDATVPSRLAADGMVDGLMSEVPYVHELEPEDVAQEAKEGAKETVERDTFDAAAMQLIARENGWVPRKRNETSAERLASKQPQHVAAFALAPRPAGGWQLAALAASNGAVQLLAAPLTDGSRGMRRTLGDLVVPPGGQAPAGSMAAHRCKSLAWDAAGRLLACGGSKVGGWVTLWRVGGAGTTSENVAAFAPAEDAGWASALAFGGQEAEHGKQWLATGLSTGKVALWALTESGGTGAVDVAPGLELWPTPSRLPVSFLRARGPQLVACVGASALWWQDARAGKADPLWLGNGGHNLIGIDWIAPDVVACATTSGLLSCWRASGKEAVRDNSWLAGTRETVGDKARAFTATFGLVASPNRALLLCATVSTVSAVQVKRRRVNGVFLNVSGFALRSPMRAMLSHAQEAGRPLYVQDVVWAAAQQRDLIQEALDMLAGAGAKEPAGGPLCAFLLLLQQLLRDLPATELVGPAAELLSADGQARLAKLRRRQHQAWVLERLRVLVQDQARPAAETLVLLDLATALHAHEPLAEPDLAFVKRSYSKLTPAAEAKRSCAQLTAPAASQAFVARAPELPLVQLGPEGLGLVCADPLDLRDLRTLRVVHTSDVATCKGCSGAVVLEENDRGSGGDCPACGLQLHSVM